jgi:hypothetical protein
MSRPAVESIPLCCNASVKESEHFIKNKIFSYSMNETWENVLKDLLEDFILTSSLHGMEAFHPNMTTNMKGDMQA